jgi:DNA-binding NtrC family response regulator
LPPDRFIDALPLLRGTTVLSVDQDAGNQRLATAHLKVACAQVYLASEVRDALACLREVRIDVLMTSFRMRNGGGTALLNAVRSHRRMAHTPIVVVTGFPLTLAEALRLGFDGFVAKPYDAAALLGELERVLAGQAGK